MKFTHIIIGAGNMGRKHGRVLEDLGDRVLYWDGRRELRTAVSMTQEADSYLVCTPAETHVKVLEELKAARPRAAVFCEKPVITNRDDKPPTFPVTLVACNWRFCACLPDLNEPGINEILFGYKASIHRELDMIHFLDLYYERLKAFPDAMAYIRGAQLDEFIMRGSRTNWRILFNHQTKEPYTIIKGHLLHSKKPCSMFIEQFKHWQACLMGKDIPCNNIGLATATTKMLLAAL